MLHRQGNIPFNNSDSPAFAISLALTVNFNDIKNILKKFLPTVAVSQVLLFYSLFQSGKNNEKPSSLCLHYRFLIVVTCRQRGL